MAWHKAGILKRGALAFSSSQVPAVAHVLRDRAEEKQVVLKFIGVDPQLPKNISSLEPNVQKLNCSLALAAVRAWLSREVGTVLTNENAITGIRSFSWPGRFQTITEESVEWYLDGAHTEASIKHAVDWFANNLDRQQRWDSRMSILSALLTNVSDSERVLPSILIFSNLSERDGIGLLRHAATSLQEKGVLIKHVIFTTYNERRDGQTRIGNYSLGTPRNFS